MRKLIIILTTLIVTIGLVGCSDKKEKDTDKVANVPVTELVTAMKEQLAEDMEGIELVDGELEGFIEGDLLDEKSEDPFSDMLLERMEINKDELAEGIFLAPLMNVKSDQIIILKAKDVKDIPALKEGLERELEAQHDTWKQYLPDQFEKVEANIILTKDTYIAYITADNPDALEKIFHEKLK